MRNTSGGREVPGAIGAALVKAVRAGLPVAGGDDDDDGGGGGDDDELLVPVAGGEWDGLDAVSAEHDQLWVARLTVDDQQIENWDSWSKDLQLLLQVGARQVGVGRVDQDLDHL